MPTRAHLPRSAPRVPRGHASLVAAARARLRRRCGASRTRSAVAPCGCRAATPPARASRPTHARSAASYRRRRPRRNVLARAVQQLKYRGAATLAAPLADLLAERYPFGDDALLVPGPAAPHRACAPAATTRRCCSHAASRAAGASRGARACLVRTRADAGAGGPRRRRPPPQRARRVRACARGASLAPARGRPDRRRAHHRRHRRRVRARPARRRRPRGPRLHRRPDTVSGTPLSGVDGDRLRDGVITAGVLDLGQRAPTCRRSSIASPTARLDCRIALVDLEPARRGRPRARPARRRPDASPRPPRIHRSREAFDAAAGRRAPRRRASSWSSSPASIDWSRAVLLDAFPDRVDEHPSRAAAGLQGTARPAPGARATASRITGATVHFVDEQTDHGPIILQGAVAVAPDDTEETLAQRILGVEHAIYPAAIQLFAEGRLAVDGRRVRIRASAARARSLPARPLPG